MGQGHRAHIEPAFPVSPVSRWTRPLGRFFELEAAAGVLLVIGTVVALVLANSPWADWFHAIWQTRFRVGFAGAELDKPLILWINDGLMALFFFVVGLEIKRELVAGELRDRRKAALPVVAALGGMVVPAAVYLALLGTGPGARGWGIPMATDIAFVVGTLALLGRHAPTGLKILLLTLAIADDIGAILVIAVLYTADLSVLYLGLAVVGFVLTYGMNRAGVRAVSAYVVVGIAIWLMVLKSGVHPTVAGVLLGLLTPASAWVGETTLTAALRSALTALRAGDPKAVPLHHVSLAARESASPLDRLEASLHPWVAFGIMPVFALANAGVRIAPGEFAHPVALAVAAGLAVGKPVGVVAFSWMAVRTGLARLPDGVNWAALAGGGCLAGIGFTMSLFIAGLALNDELLAAGKLGTLLGSLASAALGVGVLVAVSRWPRRPRRTADTGRPDGPARHSPTG
jgi:NhaA family Na+:H+ antiporter